MEVLAVFWLLWMRRLALLLECWLRVEEVVAATLVEIMPVPCLAVIPPWLSFTMGDWYLSCLSRREFVMFAGWDCDGAIAELSGL